MLLVILLIILAAVTGVLGILLKGAFLFLLVLTVLFLIGAFMSGRRSRV